MPGVPIGQGEQVSMEVAPSLAIKQFGMTGMFASPMVCTWPVNLTFTKHEDDIVSLAMRSLVHVESAMVILMILVTVFFHYESCNNCN